MAARRGASSLEAGPETDWGPGEVRVRKTEASRTRPVVPVPIQRCLLVLSSTGKKVKYDKD